MSLRPDHETTYLPWADEWRRLALGRLRVVYPDFLARSIGGNGEYKRVRVAARKVLDARTGAQILSEEVKEYFQEKEFTNVDKYVFVITLSAEWQVEKRDYSVIAVTSRRLWEEALVEFALWEEMIKKMRWLEDGAIERSRVA